MTELGQLEAQHAEFDKRKTQVVVVSIEDQEKAQVTQAQFPHLIVVADTDRHLAETLQVIHPHSDQHGKDTTAPTTILVDGSGTVRWTFRPDRFLARLSPAEVAAAIDKQMPAN